MGPSHPPPCLTGNAEGEADRGLVHREEGTLPPGSQCGKAGAAHRGGTGEHTAHTGTSAYSPNRPTWVSIKERSSSCVQEAIRKAGGTGRVPDFLSPTVHALKSTLRPC